MVSCYPTNGIQKVFNDNLHRQTVSLTDSELLDLCVRSAQNFETLKLFHRGESSEIVVQAIADFSFKNYYRR